MSCPTHGQIHRYGRVMPLINKSFWVDMDLSGRHAAKAHYLLNRNTTKGFEDFLEELIAFTQPADFIHLPIRTYSDGMRSLDQPCLQKAPRCHPSWPWPPDRRQGRHLFWQSPLQARHPWLNLPLALSG
jgi:hypothetical protein